MPVGETFAIDPELLKAIDVEVENAHSELLMPTETFIVCTAGLDLTGKISWEYLLFLLVPSLSMFGIAWKSLSPGFGKAGKGIESVAQLGYNIGNSLDEWGLDNPSRIVKEGAKVLDELGDVPTLIAKLTADGDFNMSDAKKTLEEGKEVVVAFNDTLLKFKKKPTAVVK